MANWDPNRGFFHWLLNSINRNLNQHTIDASQRVIETIKPVATTLFWIFVLLWGIAHICNKIEEPVTDGVMRLIKVGIVLGIALNITYYQQYVVDFALRAPMAFIAGASGTNNIPGSTSIGDTLDKTMFQGVMIARKVWEKAGWRHIGYYFVAIAMITSLTLVLLYAAFLIMLSKVALVLLLSLGPVFIMLLLFQATQRFFEMWMGQVINFMVAMILAVLVVALLLAFVDQYLVHVKPSNVVVDEASSFWLLAEFIALGGICVLVLRQVPTMASAISGGIGVSTLGAFSGAARAAGRAGRGAWNKATRKDVRDDARRQRIEASAEQYNKTRKAAKARMKSAFRRKASGGDSVSKA